MSDVGHGAQIVRVTEDNRFILDKNNLEEILLDKEISDLPVVIVSVAGAYRTGKSFLLNFFLRYLMAPQSARDDGSWLGKAGEPLEGFSWTCGDTRNTTGILLWSKPFICVLPSGIKVAVLLMDTQGTFDGSSTMNDCSIIFALSTLLSSVQIYNLWRNIQEDHLTHLRLFTAYGKMFKEQGNEAAFQVLIFLLRDWPKGWGAFGTEGGVPYLQKHLETNDKMHKDLKEVRAHIRSCFTKLSCFLMPNPGPNVDDQDFKGSINEISDGFKDYTRKLVDSIFRPENLQPKTINGKMVKASELCTYFKSYMNIFRSGKVPQVKDIMQATTEAGLLTALREGLTEYNGNMERECGENTPCIPPVDIKVLHERYKVLVLSNFDEKKLMGSSNDIKNCRDDLSSDIDNRVKEYAAVNEVKMRNVIDAAKNAYEENIKETNNADLFCVHPKDLEAIHNRAYTIAVNTFDSLVRRITDKKDKDRADFIKNLGSRYSLLEHQNKTNNLRVIADLRNEYSEAMERVFEEQSNLSSSQLEAKHNTALNDVLQKLKEKRNRVDTYPEDIYRDKLIDTINSRYEGIKAMNRSANRAAMNSAITIYTTYISAAWDQENEHLHPDDLVKVHEAAKDAAMNSVNISEDDTNALEDIFASRFNELHETNDAMNKEAIQSALNVFVETLQAKRRPNWWWLLIVPALYSVAVDLLNVYVEESKQEAVTEFYRKRKNKRPEDVVPEIVNILRSLHSMSSPEYKDVYLRDLIKKIDDYNSILMKIAKKGAEALKKYMQDAANNFENLF